MSGPDRFRMIAEVYLLFRRGDEILLSKRANTGYQDGRYGLVSGHVDGGEPLAAAAAREALEEAGVAIDPADLTLRLVMHRKSEDERLGFFFAPARWAGELVNAEPHKCDELRWASVVDLPEETIPYIREAIRCVEAGETYAAWWNRPD